MTNWDEQMRARAKQFQVPETYHKKVEKLLGRLEAEELEKDACRAPRDGRLRKTVWKGATAVVVVCLFVMGYAFFSEAEVTQAGFLETFKQTILDALGLDEEVSARMGIERQQEQILSKPELLIELQETILDAQNIYALVKIVAPPRVAFADGMTFDYYGFCRGTNYNVDGLLSGAKDCALLEVSPTKPNVATFLVNLSTDEQVQEGDAVTVFFKDLITGYAEEETQTVVEGMWSLTFSASNMDTKEITVKGEPYMQYTLLDTQVNVKKLRLLPLGLTLVTDVTMIPTDVLNTSDTRITIRLRMIDDSEITVISPDVDVWTLSSESSLTQTEKNGVVKYKLVSQFDEAIDIEKVMGVYVEDCYISLLDME